MSPFSIRSFPSRAWNPSGPLNSGYSLVWKFSRSRLKPVLMFMENWGGELLRPRLVKIWITPLVASDP